MLRRVLRPSRVLPCLKQQTAAFSHWGNVKMGPKDPILGVTEAFKADKSPDKLNLGVGAYRNDAGKPVVLDSVREAERRVIEQKLDSEYAPITGIKSFVDNSLKLVFGNNPADLEKIAALQSLSGTGSLRVAAGFIARNWDGPLPDIYVSDPTWGNHYPIFEHQGFKVKKYPYWDPDTKGLAYDKMIDAFKAAPDNSVFILHATAHNPTGVDPTVDQWKGMSQALKAKNHMVLMDCAYQGFASGDFDQDKAGFDIMVKDGHKMMLCQSFAKNFGLYGQRIGCFSVMTDSKEEQEIVMSQLKIVARAIWSNPPVHGARIVDEILKDPQLTAQWKGEVKDMAGRIIKMRQMLKDGLIAEGSSLNWDHVTDQIGMFCYSGMTGEQVDKLASDWHIYMTRNGRISMAGVTSGSVGYLAKAMHAVTNQQAK